MNIINEIKEAMEKKKVIYGFRKCIKYLKFNEPKLVIVAKSLPEEMKKDIIDEVKETSKIVEVDMNAIELGLSLGKPFPISVVVIKKW